MPAYFTETEPTGKKIWEGMKATDQVRLTEKLTKELDFRLGLFKVCLKNEELYDYLKDKVKVYIEIE